MDCELNSQPLPRMKDPLTLIFGTIGAAFITAVYYFLWKKPMASTDESEMEIPVVVAPEVPVVPPAPRFAPMIMRWSKAITRWEGATAASNNPGNLKYASLTASWGATKGRKALDGGNFCQFNTLQEGEDALCHFLTLACEGQLIISHPKPCTLEQFTVRYAGNPPMGYKLGIYSMMGVSPQVDISTFLDVVK